ncbi:hypothetical protein [Planococcus salinus]|uniref:Uncharacterized protein n=1 Tax=Planococcus salinus TaxID=1848460 RepID=A0A3M8P7X6_9BACL|nr:hypothetical protein [Planococcus salinus]RNF39370.1 hypothetical protein EEX84_09805 [Planococcus salinus]
MYEGDMGPLLLGAGSLIIVYFTIDLIVWRTERTITFHADILAPIAVFTIAVIGSFVIREIQDWSLFLPLIMLITIIPTSLLLTLIKTGVVLNNKKRNSS